jgi:drug/metabolite transporter (DMT)-like permease
VDTLARAGTKAKGTIMNNVAIVYILISVVAGAVGQIMLKKGMSTIGPLTFSVDQLFNVLLKIAMNPYVVIGLFVYVFGVVFWLFALSRVDLSFAYPFASLSYIVMLLASWLLFGENITLMRVAGTIVIGLGVLLISRS